MKVLAIDGSTKSTGWSVFENNKLLDYGLITASNKNVLDRIPVIVNGLMAVLLKYQPDEVVMEEVIPEDVNHNQTTYKSLMYLQAMIAIAFHQRGKALNFYTASEWRKKCGIHTGRGIKRDEVKAADIKFVADTYNLQVNDDIADAICIGYAYSHKTAVTQHGFIFE